MWSSSEDGESNTIGRLATDLNVAADYVIEVRDALDNPTTGGTITNAYFKFIINIVIGNVVSSNYGDKIQFGVDKEIIKSAPQNIIGIHELNLVLNNWGQPGTITLT